MPWVAWGGPGTPPDPPLLRACNTNRFPADIWIAADLHFVTRYSPAHQVFSDWSRRDRYPPITNAESTDCE